MFIRHFDYTTDHKTTFEYDKQAETITVRVDGVSEIIDLSDFPIGAKFEGIETDLAMDVLHDVKRTEEGLYVTLFNAVPKKFPAIYDTSWKEVDEDGALRPIGGDGGGADPTEESESDLEDEGATGAGRAAKGTGTD